MKRYSVASLAAITALSLVTMPADAAEKRSSDISGNQGIGYAYDEYYEAKPWVRDLMKGTATEQREKLAPYASSFQQDWAKDRAPGTTADILIGTGVVALIFVALGGAAVSQGAVQLPF
ncbi:hypothetical protein [Corynebacterium afermentans]|uniref:hypothetical protein n=1 Tax=Corynebacterium afermentans TaxID=38286 RepID=UPI002572D912|nr:hypothetical protein [Corynebacterium afermentans]MDC7108973.1 hypothetical protein [Corynebacterium afermentans]